VRSSLIAGRVLLGPRPNRPPFVRESEKWPLGRRPGSEPAHRELARGGGRPSRYHFTRAKAVVGRGPAPSLPVATSQPPAAAPPSPLSATFHAGAPADSLQRPEASVGHRSRRPHQSPGDGFAFPNVKMQLEAGILSSGAPSARSRSVAPRGRRCGSHHGGPLHIEGRLAQGAHQARSEALRATQGFRWLPRLPRSRQRASVIDSAGRMEGVPAAEAKRRVQGGGTGAGVPKRRTGGLSRGSSTRGGGSP
jgi:hypothetical protein